MVASEEKKVFLKNNRFRTRKKGELTLCHMADVHLGYRRYNRLTRAGLNQREVDINQAFREAVTRVIAIRPDLIVIAGDLFHNVRPSNAVVTFCFREVRRLAQGTNAPVVIVAGNHESPKRADTGCVLQLLAEIPNVFVADARIERFSFADLDLSILCLPHAGLDSSEELLIRADDRFKHNVLVVHGQVNEAWVSEFGGAAIDFKSLSPNEWEYIALGHVHLNQDLGFNAAYSGALEHTASNIWAEANRPKGFLEVTLPTAKRIFHPLSSPREVVVLEKIDGFRLEGSDLMHLIEERIANLTGGIEGKIIKLEIMNVSRDAQRQLNFKRLRELRSKALNFTLDIRAPQIVGASTINSQPRAGRLRDELLEFIKEGRDQESVAKLGEIIAGYLTKVEAEDEVIGA